jgi:hypothetical protein
MADTIDDVAAEADVAAEPVEQGAADEAPATSTHLKRPEKNPRRYRTYEIHPVRPSAG